MAIRQSGRRPDRLTFRVEQGTAGPVEVRGHQQRDHPFSVGPGARRQEANHCLDQAEQNLVTAEEVAADVGPAEPWVKASNVRVRAALRRVEDEHLVTGDGAHVHGHGAIGFFGIEIAERPDLAEAGMAHDKDTRLRRRPRPTLPQPRSGLAQDHEAAQVVDGHDPLDALGRFLVLGHGEDPGREAAKASGRDRVCLGCEAQWNGKRG
jgi:hypothetical protein